MVPSLCLVNMPLLLALLYLAGEVDMKVEKETAMRDKDKQTELQEDRQTDRATGRQKEKKTETVRKADRQTEREAPNNRRC